MPRTDALDRPAPEPAADPEPPPGLIVEVVEDAGGWPALGDVTAIIAPVLTAVKANAQLSRHLPAEVCIALVDDAAMRRLNGQFRAKDKPTNVLSFPSAMPAVANQRRHLGDIALGFETVMREAAAQRIAPPDHVRHLVLHGLLHLMGFDHESEAEAAVMEALEIEILAGLGIADPYEEAASAPAAP